MSREMELIQEIDEHIKKADGLYGLELSNSDLNVIRAALHKTIAVAAVKTDFTGSSGTFTATSCPNCWHPVINYFEPQTYCQFCGQALKKMGGDPPSEE